MTGPEHYRVAEEALRQAKAEPAGTRLELHLTAHAQVHAMLALAAATALRQVDGALPQPDYRAWYDTAVTRQEATRG